jgi:FMN-dependent NADH-azoreductase
VFDGFSYGLSAVRNFVFLLFYFFFASINVTIESPLKNYTEDTVSVYQKTVYSTSDGTASMLNIKRLSISVSALSSDENWYAMLKFDDVEDYRITVEVQK